MALHTRLAPFLLHRYTIYSLILHTVELVSAHRTYAGALSKASFNLSQTAGPYATPLQSSTLVWQVDASARADTLAALLESLDASSTFFAQSGRGISEALDQSVKRQQDNEQALGSVIKDVLAVWTLFAARTGMKATYSDVLPPDPWLHDRRLAKQAAVFVEAKQTFTDALLELYERAFALERRLSAETSQVIGRFVSELRVQGSEGNAIDSEWNDSLHKHRLDHNWHFDEHALPAFLHSIRALIAGAVLQRHAVRVKPFDLVKTGTVSRPTKGPRSWFASAHSAAAWNRPAILILTSSGFLHLYNNLGGEDESILESKRLFRPDHSLDIRRFAISPTDSAHHIFTISSAGAASSTKRESEKKLQLRAASADDMVDWCVAIGNTAAILAKTPDSENGKASPATEEAQELPGNVSEADTGKEDDAYYTAKQAAHKDDAAVGHGSTFTTSPLDNPWDE